MTDATARPRRDEGADRGAMTGARVTPEWDSFTAVIADFAQTVRLVRQ